MKRFTFYAVLCILLPGCHQIPTFNKEITGKHEVCLQLELSASVDPFPKSRGIPELPAEPGTNGNTSNPFSFEYVYFALIDASTQEIIDESQIWKQENIDDFGSYLYLSLPPGSYIITVITHSSFEANLEDDLFKIEDLTDTFCGSASFEIENQRKEVTIHLSRMVSRVEFVPTDEIPDEVEEFCIHLPQQYHAINIQEGASTNHSQGYVYRYIFTEEEKADKEMITHAFYTFVPEHLNNKLPYIELIVKGKEGKTLYTKKVTNIPVHANRITQYSGLLYTSGMGDGTFDLDFQDGGDWGGTDEYPLP